MVCMAMFFFKKSASILKSKLIRQTISLKFVTKVISSFYDLVHPRTFNKKE